MNIIIQIKTIIFSIVFGFIFSVSLRFNYRFIVGSKKVLSAIVTFLFVLVFTFLYFIVLKKINFAVFHFYEIICIIFGFIFENLMCRLVEKKCKK